MRVLSVLAAALPFLLVPAAAPAAPQQSAESTGETADTPFARALALLEAGDAEGAVAVLEPLRGADGADPRGLSLLGALYVDTGRPAEALQILEPLAAGEQADPALLYHASRAAQALGRNDQAEEYLVRSAAASPVSPAARALGLVRALQGRYGEAFRLLVPWTRRSPEDREARLAAAQAAVRLGRAPEARELLAGLDADAPRVRLLQADLAMLLGKPREALTALEPVLADPPEGLAGEIRGLGADAYLLSDQPDRAVELLQGETGVDPRLNLLLARAQRQLGRTEEAIATLRPIAEQFLARESDGPAPLLAAAIVLDYGRFQAAAGRTREAEQTLRAATDMNPASRLAWQSLAEVLSTLGQEGEAEEAERRAEELAGARTARTPPAATPTGAGTADLDAAFQSLMAGDTLKGLELVREEKERAPRDPWPWLLEVQALMSLDRNEEALQAAEAAVQAFPELADAVYQRGVVRMGRGEEEEAEQDFRRALELSPSHTAVMNDLAVLLMTRGRREEARELLQRVLEIRPDDKLATANLQRLEERMREGDGP